MIVDSHESANTDDEVDRNAVDRESWIAEQARLVVLEDGY